MYVICSRGGEDAVLTQNPSITFWKICFRKYTTFALETAEEQFKGGVGFGQKMSAVIDSERADLVTNIDLVVTVPAIKPDCAKGVRDVHWTNSFGYAFVRTVKVIVGGATLSQQYGESMYIWSELNRDVNHTLGELTGRRYTVRQLIEDAKSPHTYYVPLDLWFSNSHGNAYPLVAAYKSGLEIVLESRALNDLWLSRGASPNAVPLRVDNGAPLSDNDVQASLYVTYVYLDRPERTMFFERPHEYVIEQTQTTRAQPFAGAGSNLQSSFSVPLPFNGPTRYIAWVLQSDEAARSKNWFHYADVATGSDLMHSATIRVKGHDLFSPKGALWFRGVETRRAFKHTPEKHIYAKSFGIDARHAQPSGTINFGELQPAFLDLTLQSAAYAGVKSYGRFKGVEPQTIHATVYAKVIKILRFYKGRVSFAYHC